MSQPDRRPPQRGPLALPSLNIAQVLALFVELRDLAQELIALHRQHIELLQSGTAGQPDDLELITVADAARLLSFDPRTVHRLIAEGELAAVGSAHRLRVQRASIRSYIERHRDQIEACYGSKHR